MDSMDGMDSFAGVLYTTTRFDFIRILVLVVSLPLGLLWHAAYRWYGGDKMKSVYTLTRLQPNQKERSICFFLDVFVCYALLSLPFFVFALVDIWMVVLSAFGQWFSLQRWPLLIGHSVVLFWRAIRHMTQRILADFSLLFYMWLHSEF